jgi:hypothetical protein
MSDLRERIAAVLHNAFDGKFYGHLPDHVFLDQADAVIAEMGLRQETVGLIHRWVTDWQHDKASYCLRCGIPHTTPCKRGTK